MTASDAVVTSLAVFPVVVPVGRAQRINAFAKLSDGTTREVTDQVTWSSDNPAFATISNAAGSRGLVTALAIGRAQITAVLDGVTATTTATIIDAVPTSIAVTPADLSLAAGLSQGYRATWQFTDGTTRDVTDDVTWDVLDSNIAVMLSGVRGVAVARDRGHDDPHPPRSRRPPGAADDRARSRESAGGRRPHGPADGDRLAQRRIDRRRDRRLHLDLIEHGDRDGQ